MKKEYILKNKNIPVYTFFMDDENFKIQSTGKILEKEHLPFNMQDIETNERKDKILEIFIDRVNILDKVICNLGKNK